MSVETSYEIITNSNRMMKRINEAIILLHDQFPDKHDSDAIEAFNFVEKYLKRKFETLYYNIKELENENRSPKT